MESLRILRGVGEAAQKSNGYACMLSRFSPVQLFAAPWTVAYQAPLSTGIPQTRILEWVAMPFSRGSSGPRDQISYVSWIDRQILLPPGKPPVGKLPLKSEGLWTCLHQAQVFALYKGGKRKGNMKGKEWRGERVGGTVYHGSMAESESRNSIQRRKVKPSTGVSGSPLMTSRAVIIHAACYRKCIPIKIHFITCVTSSLFFPLLFFLTYEFKVFKSLLVLWVEREDTQRVSNIYNLCSYLLLQA